MKYRRPCIVLLQLVLVALSHYAAFWLRFDGDIPADQMRLFVLALPSLIVIRGIIFFPFRLYEGLWRYTSIWDLRNIIMSVGLSSLVHYAVVRWVHLQGYSRAVLAIDTMILISLLGALRLGRRLYREMGHPEHKKRILIYGAGDAGEMIVRDMRGNPFHEFEPVGFIDDDPLKVGQRIHGVKVLGSRQDLAKIVIDENPDAILVAMPRAEPAIIRSIVRALEPFKVPIQTLPNLRDIIDGKVSVSQIRTLSVEDLLERAPVRFAAAPLQELIKGKRVLVTGAGGSIGSELARQISSLAPASLVLLDRYENGLHALMLELTQRAPRHGLDGIVADVTDADLINIVLTSHRPEIVFHAAAHKHVPLMELNPCEAVRNNVRGTRVLAEASQRFGVKRLVLISTDKAVNPLSMMGATKRVAELLVQSINQDAGGTFSAVRFGNVLASNGSVVPHFLEQIKAGGPVTVTHPEMRRYFMLIPEAVHLVLQAAALAGGGSIFALEMGEQVKVLDLARNLIRLSGFVPDKDIPITFIGMRPGEKLSEELVGQDEFAEPSSVVRVLRITSGPAPEWESFRDQVVALENFATAGDVAAVSKRLCELVPTYRPEEASR
jgi:FlaA1/EpsC-like NDP-sugar epimerase